MLSIVLTALNTLSNFIFLNEGERYLLGRKISSFTGMLNISREDPTSKVAELKLKSRSDGLYCFFRQAKPSALHVDGCTITILLGGVCTVDSHRQ